MAPGDHSRCGFGLFMETIGDTTKSMLFHLRFYSTKSENDVDKWGSVFNRVTTKTI